jgi:hypothetical protein
VERLVTIRARQTALSRLIVANRSSHPLNSALGAKGSVSLHSVVLYAGKWAVSANVATGSLALTNCVIAGSAQIQRPTRLHIRDSLHVSGEFDGWWHAQERGPQAVPCVVENSLLHGVGGCISGEFRQSTFKGSLLFEKNSGVVRDCVVNAIGTDVEDVKVENSCVAGPDPISRRVKLGKGCFKAKPQFRNPDILDYRLKPKSPGTGRAADGGDIGVRYTPEMLEMLKLALELRKKGIIKF